MRHLRPIDWVPDQANAMLPGHVRILDQTRLPGAPVYIDTTDLEAVWRAIKTLQVRGAPVIGVAAALGVAAAAQDARGGSREDVLGAVDHAADYLATSRPTAVNLFWAVDRMRKRAHASSSLGAGDLVAELVREALAIRDEDLAMCRAIGAHGAALLADGGTVLTHCNAGALATSGYGTALAPVYVAQEQGRCIHVFADETRPLLQGARLTAWELMRAGIDVTLICDNMAAQVM
jgi:methylthioribose-1-phosphate isomerase